MAGREVQLDAFTRIDRWSQLELQELLAEARSSFAAGKLDDVFDLCLLGLTQFPNAAPLLAILGWVYAQRSDFAQAEATFRHALCHDEASADAQAGLGAVLAAGGNFSDAVKYYRRALDLQPGDAHSQFNLGCALLSLRRFDEAIEALQRSIELDATQSEAFHNLAIAHAQVGRWDAAVEHCERALAADSQAWQARLMRGMSRIALGSFAAGWDDYEARNHSQGAGAPRFGLPPWTGPGDTRQSVVVLPEQGVGTQVLFASCLPDLFEHVAHVSIGCEPRLVGLLRRSFPGVNVLAADLVPAVARCGLFDSYVMAGSLPQFFRRSAEAFRGATYLEAESFTRQRWRRRLDALGPGLKIGVSWGGGGNKPDAMHRRTRPDEWQLLAAIPNTHWINLQHDAEPHELAAWQRMTRGRFHEWDDFDKKFDLENLAALVAELDLVMTVVNSSIHFAGALGVPTWALVPRGGEWRWLSRGERCVWHDSVRLFRQAGLDDWGSVFDKLHAELAPLAANVLGGGRRSAAA